MEPSEDCPDPSEFVRHIVQYVAKRRITLEVCLSSNLGTMPGLRLEDHAFAKMLREQISVTLCTDNRLVSNTDTVKEMSLAAGTFGMSPKQLRDMVITGFKRSFFHGAYTEKRAYVRGWHIIFEHGGDMAMRAMTGAVATAMAGGDGGGRGRWQWPVVRARARATAVAVAVAGGGGS